MTIGWTTRHTARGIAVATIVVVGAACGDAAAPGDPGTDARVLSVVRGNSQISAAGSDLPSPLVVRVTNSRGRPIAGVALSWTTQSGG